MKTASALWPRIVLVCSLLFLSSAATYGKDDLKSLSDYLNYIIMNKELFTNQKEQDIANLKKLLTKNESSPEYIFEVNKKLYNEYKKYKLDSAIHYALENVRIAEKIKNPRFKQRSSLNLAIVYSYSGKFIESNNILNSIQPNQLPKDLLEEYYDVRSQFYGHYSIISSQNSYYAIQELYKDSLLQLLDPSSYGYRINMVEKFTNARQFDKAEEWLLDILKDTEIDSPQYAMITHSLGGFYGARGQRQKELKYHIKSAIADIKNSIKENASFQRLATIYYNNGDISKAFLYSQSAIEDAVFSGVQFRTAEMFKFYSIINAAHQAKESKAKRKLRTYLAFISILSFLLILLVLYVYKQVKKLSRMKEEISQTNERLKALNMELHNRNILTTETNDQLSESNQVKEQYIAQFFNLCSTYIDKMADFRKGLYKLAINRQYEEVVKRLKSTSLIDVELEDLYKHFDSTFLTLYPTFVTDFNALLEKDEQIHPKGEFQLNRELRIYALLRLGITDSTKISSFLRCSMSTIYNYRTKMRNKATYSREEFEERVMKIGNQHFQQ